VNGTRATRTVLNHYPTGVFFSFSYWTSAVGAYTKSHAYDSPLLLYRESRHREGLLRCWRCGGRWKSHV